MSPSIDTRIVASRPLRPRLARGHGGRGGRGGPGFDVTTTSRLPGERLDRSPPPTSVRHQTLRDMSHPHRFDGWFVGPDPFPHFEVVCRPSLPDLVVRRTRRGWVRCGAIELRAKEACEGETEDRIGMGISHFPACFTRFAPDTASLIHPTTPPAATGGPTASTHPSIHTCMRESERDYERSWSMHRLRQAPAIGHGGRVPVVPHDHLAPWGGRLRSGGPKHPDRNAGVGGIPISPHRLPLPPVSHSSPG